MLPIAVWHHLIETERHTPTMTGEIIKRLIIEHAHQLRLGWLSVWSRDVQGPLLLLSWSQTVAEGLPLDVQFLFRQRMGDAQGTSIALAFLHKTIVDDDARSIFLLVSERKGNDAVTQLPSALLQEFITCDYRIDDVRSVLGRAHLYIDWFAITRERLGSLIIPFSSWLHRMRILDAKDSKLLLQGIGSADSFQFMHTRCQRIDWHRNIGISISPFTLIDTILQAACYLHAAGIAIRERHGLQAIRLDALWQINRKGSWLRAQRQTHRSLMALTTDVGHNS